MCSRRGSIALDENAQEDKRKGQTIYQTNTAETENLPYQTDAGVSQEPTNQQSPVINQQQNRKKRYPTGAILLLAVSLP